ncbi:hypothetical protein M0805_003388 [Coniferiporia weirii]|nr:hypothetical protein M0805_003388 [Coniferiporia weirii]
MLSPDHDHDQTPRPRSGIQPRRKGPPQSLRIDTPAQNPAIALVLGDSSASASSLSSANSESDFPPPFSKPTKPRSMRNTKKLSLTLPSAHSNVSSNSLTLTLDNNNNDAEHTVDTPVRPVPSNTLTRRASVMSLPSNIPASRLHRKDEDDSPSTPYADGPVQILPGVWLGSEDNALNWKGLERAGIRSILNVAKEVVSPFDSVTAAETASTRASASESQDSKELDSTFYPAHGVRPAMHYLKLRWSHGQPDLVKDGFVTAMAFVDSALSRGDGVLIHCQCGVSRSATVVIALVMRAAAQSLPSTPAEVLALKGSGFAGAYDFVKGKSSCIGPNMLLIYQLQDYQQVLNGTGRSPSNSAHSSVVGDDEEDWSRRRRLLESDQGDCDSVEVREAHALDRAMEERVVSRKTSASSTCSSSGIGMGSAWKTRYSNRKRTSSIASNFTSGSIISEDLVEESEKEELLGVGGGFDAPSISTRSPSGETTEEEVNVSPDWTKAKHTPHLQVNTPSTARPSIPVKQWSFHASGSSPFRPPPSAPATRTTFGFTARLPFKTKSKARPPPLNSLPPVPASPDVSVPPEVPALPKVQLLRRRAVPPPLHLGDKNGLLSTRTSSRSSNLSQISQTSTNTPSQTLFVFPASPTLKSHTSHMVTVTSSLNAPLPFSTAPTPRVSTFKSEGRRRSFIGLMAPPTPTTACSRVDARGWIGTGARDS